MGQVTDILKEEKAFGHFSAFTGHLIIDKTCRADLANLGKGGSAPNEVCQGERNGVIDSI